MHRGLAAIVPENTSAIQSEHWPAGTGLPIFLPFLCRFCRELSNERVVGWVEWACDAALGCVGFQMPRSLHGRLFAGDVAGILPECLPES